MFCGFSRVSSAHAEPADGLGRREGRSHGRFACFAVTTLEKMLLSRTSGNRRRPLKLVAIEERPVRCSSLPRNLFGNVGGATSTRGVHFEEADEISIEGENTNLILDGEMFRTQVGRPIVLKPASPLSFVRLAA
jgi:hypothetical protein